MNRTWVIIETEAEPKRAPFLTQSGNVFISDSSLAQRFRSLPSVCCQLMSLFGAKGP